MVFLDDDEVVLAPDFMEKALYGLGHETRQRLPILAKSGYFYNKAGSPLADTSKKNGITCRWWTKRIEFNRWMERALSGTRISRSNYVCGGCFAIHARAFKRVAFDPYITRGEDLDYLFNMRLSGMDVWFDNAWVVKHLPPHQVEESPRFMQNVYRWYYERAKLASASRRPEVTSVTAASLMPYPGPWISSGLDERVRKTALVRMLFTREHRGYWHIYRHGIARRATMPPSTRTITSDLSVFGRVSWAGFPATSALPPYWSVDDRTHIARTAQKSQGDGVHHRGLVPRGHARRERGSAPAGRARRLYHGGLFGYAILTGVETLTTIAALVLLVLFTCGFIYVFFSPDTLRSQYTEQMLAVPPACSRTSPAASRARAPRRSADACCPRRAP